MAPVPGPGYAGGMAGYNAATKQLLEQFEELTLGPSAPGQPQDAGGPTEEHSVVPTCTSGASRQSASMKQHLE